MKQKLILGTVQLGLSYGINNKTGRPDIEESFQILDTALENNISMLDSADAYGNSLEVIGTYFEKKPDSFRIVSKFVNDNQKSIREKLSATLDTLHIKRVYSYMYHRFSDYESGSVKNELNTLKEEGLLEKIGVSVYGLNELSAVVDDPQIEVIQLPYNVFDSSQEKIDLLANAKKKGKEIHVRSVFLQGLFFKKPEELTGNLTALSKPLTLFHEAIQEHNISVMEACLNHACNNPSIDHVIVGVERAEQLKENLSAVIGHLPEAVNNKLKSIYVEDTGLLNPSNWKP